MKILGKLVYWVLILVSFETEYVQSQLLGPDQYELSEDGQLTFSELAEKYGHSCETKYVITEDGYNLTLFHIPGKKEKPVLLVHGNTATADCWIIRANASLALTLANRDYDVWALNFRGNRYSRRHISLDPDVDAAQFFDFTFYEQGIYDLPATIDFILKDTEQEKLAYVSHSAGATALFVLGSEKPEYNDKIKIHISLAPVCFLGEYNVPTNNVPIHLLVSLIPSVGVYEFLNHEDSKSYVRLFCLQSFGYELCVKGLAFTLFGYDEEGLEPEFTNTLFGHWPGGASIKFTNHQNQVSDRDRFSKYDYGMDKNLVVYGSLDPPDFDLSKVTMKTAMFVGSADPYTSPSDVARLIRSLPNVVHYQILPYDKFSHADFTWGRYMDSNLYPYVLPVLAKYS